MSNPIIWAPGTSISANGTMKSEAFIAYDGQTEFTLTAFTYAVGTGSLYVFVSGAAQRAGVDYLETGTDRFTLSEGVPVDTIVYVIAFTSIIAEIPTIGITPADIGTNLYLKTDASGTTFDSKTATQVRTDIGAEPSDSTILKEADIGVSGGVQAYDVDTLKADTADILTAGFAATPYNAGIKSSGTFTPDETSGNFQYCVNGGAFTLDPPINNCTIVIQITNNSSAGTITTSGFTKVTGTAPVTTDGYDFFAYITKCNGFSHLAWQALQ